MSILRLKRALVRLIFWGQLSGGRQCFIAQNCIGSRIYRLQRRQYSSPTIDLWMAPGDFLRFCSDLETHLHAEILFDAASSAERGYPVGRVNGLKIMFMHFDDFDVAVETWRRRAARVSIEDVFILMTDRDGFTPADLAMFDALPTRRKLLFSHRPLPGIANVVYVPGYEELGSIGNLTGEYHHFLNRRVRSRLIELLKTG